MLNAQPEKRDLRLSQVMSDLVSFNSMQLNLDLSRPRYESHIFHKDESRDSLAGMVGPPNPDLAYWFRPEPYRHDGVPMRSVPLGTDELDTPIARALLHFHTNGILPEGKKSIQWLDTMKSTRSLMRTFWGLTRAARIDRMQMGASWLPRMTIVKSREIRVLSQFESPATLAKWTQEEREIRARDAASPVSPPSRGTPPTPEAPRQKFVPIIPHGDAGPAKKEKPKHSIRPRPKKSDALLREGFQALPSAVADSDDEEPEPEPARDAEAPLPDDDPLTGIKKVMRVDDMLVFDLLWSSDSGEVKRRITWDDFEGAMKRAGCTTTQPSGSATKFKLNGDPVGQFRACTIHSDHGTGEGSIPPHYLRNWGVIITLGLKWEWKHFALMTAEEKEAARAGVEELEGLNLA